MNNKSTTKKAMEKCEKDLDKDFIDCLIELSESTGKDRRSHQKISKLCTGVLSRLMILTIRCYYNALKRLKSFNPRTRK